MVVMGYLGFLLLLQKQTVMAYFFVLSQHLSRWREACRSLGQESNAQRPKYKAGALNITPYDTQLFTAVREHSLFSKPNMI
jgi:hypothetical protein